MVILIPFCKRSQELDSETKICLPDIVILFGDFKENFKNLNWIAGHETRMGVGILCMQFT